MAPMVRILRKFLRGLLRGMLCVLLWNAAAQAVATVQRIDVGAGGTELEVVLSQRTAFKALQLDTREIMVAFKSVDLAGTATGGASDTGLVKQFAMEELPDQVVSLMIDTTRDVRGVKAQWKGDTATLLVHLYTDKVPAATEISVKHRRFKKEALLQSGVETHSGDTPSLSGESDPASTPISAAEPSPDAPLETAPAAAAATSPVSDTAKLPDALSGGLTLSSLGEASPSKEVGLSAVMEGISKSGCAERSSVLEDALQRCQKNKWEKAYTLLRTGIDPSASNACQADLYYLKAFAAYKMNTAGSEQLYLDTVSYFQDALSYYPDATHAPFAMLTLATIYDDIGSSAQAKGYFKLILKTYPDHPVASEAMMGLGELYAKEQKQELAIDTFRQYLKTYPQSSRVTDVRLALGKSLYELSEFTDSLDMLSRVLEEDPRRVYENPDLLVYIGDLYYQLGNVDSARQAMIKAVNLYPDSDDVSVLLARIGDTFKDDGREDQAKKVYDLVMKTYPDTDGAAVSSVRYADLLSDRNKKEAQYRAVIKRFPEHPMAKLAVIRLADLQYQAGKYDAGIETLRDLISGGTKELRDEAEYVMAMCFEGFFTNLADRNDPLAVIAAYEKDKTLINRFENPEIFETVGTAFYQANFFKQAEELFQVAYKVSSPESRTAGLYYRLAVTHQELGKDMQAREMFQAYFRKLPENEIDPDAYLRMGRLLAAEESWETALAFADRGLLKSESNIQRAAFMMLQAQVYTGMGKESTVPDFLIKAINLLSSSPDVSDEQLMQAYRSLGESYMKLSTFEKATDAFAMALNFSGDERPPALLYRLAESNLKSQHPESARIVLSEIVNAGDEFWVRMAEEQLRSLAIEEKLGTTSN